MRNKGEWLLSGLPATHTPLASYLAAAGPWALQALHGSQDLPKVGACTCMGLCSWRERGCSYTASACRSASPCHSLELLLTTAPLISGLSPASQVLLRPELVGQGKQGCEGRSAPTLSLPSFFAYAEAVKV